MKVLARAAVLAGAIVLLPMTAMADPLTYGGLKSMVENMGHTINEISATPGSEKFEVTITTGAFNVPLGLEVAKSTRYIWCTASLGKSTLTGERALELLKRGGSVQPTSFWITDSGDLKIGVAIDNREVTPAHMKFVMEKLAADVGSTADLWQAREQ